MTAPSIDAVIARELAALRASDASQLQAGAPRRALVAGPARTLPVGDGRALQIPILLTAGAPSNLRVPTELSLWFAARIEDDRTVAVTQRPERADLATAVSMALAGETRALEASVRALEGAGVSLPPGTRRWADALRTATIDARLPRAQFVGEPSWQLLFEPWDPARGWNSVTVDARHFGALSVNGR